MHLKMFVEQRPFCLGLNVLSVRPENWDGTFEG